MTMMKSCCRVLCKTFGWVAIACCVVLFAQLHQLSLPPPIPTASQVTADGAIPVILENGNMVEVFEGGVKTGTPLIVVTGFGSTGKYLLAKPYLSIYQQHNLRLLAVSLPGHGFSSLTPKRNITEFSFTVQAVADHFGADRFYLAGISLGAEHVAAAATSERLSKRILGLGLFSPHGPKEIGHAVIMPAEPMEQRIIHGVVSAPLIGDGLANFMASLSFDDMAEFVPSMAAFLKDAPSAIKQAVRDDFQPNRAFKYSRYGFRHLFMLLEKPWGFDFQAALKRIDNVVISYGTKDSMLPQQLIQYFGSLNPHAKLVPFEDDHFYLYTQWSALVDVLVTHKKEEKPK